MFSGDHLTLLKTTDVVIPIHLRFAKLLGLVTVDMINGISIFICMKKITLVSVISHILLIDSTNISIITNNCVFLYFGLFIHVIYSL